MNHLRKNLFLLILLTSLLIFAFRFSPATLSQSIDTQENFHHLGHPADGLLIWENDEEFLNLRNANGAFIRMAAFQTTLPDPLPGEEYNVGLAAQMIAGTVVQPGQIFSLNGTLGPRTREKGFREGPAYSGGQVIRVIGGGICKISTTLYNVAVLANMEIVERWAHGMLVPYVPPGQDATVSYGSRDFKFRNNTGKPVLIWAEKVNNTLFMAFYGSVTPPRISWRHEVLSCWEMPVIEHYNRWLKPGEKRVIQPGAEGIRVKNWINIQYRSGKTETEYLGIDYYRPMPMIVEIGK